MTISAKLTSLNAAKSAIAAAITAQGVDVTGSTFAEYADRIAEIEGTGAGGGWVRNPLWLDLPAVTSSEQKMVGLHAVWPDAGFVALSCAGNYTVDWGDGVIEDFASGVQANHEYSFADPDLTATALPYKQSIITVTPRAGQNMTALNLFLKHNRTGLVNNYSTGWLDLRISGPSLTTLVVSGTSTTTVAHRNLEQVEILSIGSATIMANMFTGCTSLTSLPLFNTAAVTNMSGTFTGCTSLTSLPLFNTAAVTNTSNMFNGCTSLTTVPLFNMSAVLNMSGMFTGCTALRYVPALELSSVTSASSYVSGCVSLNRIDATGLGIIHSIASCMLSAAALDAYYTGLPTLPGRTVTVTGNYGASGDNPSIATAKGWTVTG